MDRLTPACAVLDLAAGPAFANPCRSTPHHKRPGQCRVRPAELYPVTGTGFCPGLSPGTRNSPVIARWISHRWIRQRRGYPQTLVMGRPGRLGLMTPERQQGMQQAWAAAMDGFQQARARGTGNCRVLRIAAKSRVSRRGDPRRDYRRRPAVSRFPGCGGSFDEFRLYATGQWVRPAGGDS